jgi:phage shock protein PspC (stress-responsive transcriptional regulator)
MTDDTPTIERSERHEEPPRRLRRSSSDRVLTGVAGGLGRYFGIDPMIFRIGFALSIFFGGLGGLAYLLLSIFVPTDGEPDLPQRVGGRLQGKSFWRVLGVIALVALAVAGLFVLAGGAAFAVAIGWGTAVAIAIIAIVVARYFYGLSYDEIADHFQIKSGTVGATLHQAVERLRQVHLAGRLARGAMR